MAHTILKLTFSAGILLAGAMVAQAADLNPAPPVIHAPASPHYAAGGWYLRGDIGVAVGATADRIITAPSGVSESWKAGKLLGVGVGYKFNDYLRADVTADHRFGGSARGTQECIAGNSDCTTNYGGDFTSSRFMANAYVDLGNFSGFTPYLGAGIGVHHTKFDGYFRSFACQTGHPNCAAAGTSSLNEYAGSSKMGLVYSAMLGGSFELSEKTSLDVGYQYSRMHDIELTNSNRLNGPRGVNALDTHDIRAGIRYHF